MFIGILERCTSDVHRYSSRQCYGVICPGTFQFILARGFYYCYDWTSDCNTHFSIISTFISLGAKPPIEKLKDIFFRFP